MLIHIVQNSALKTLLLTSFMSAGINNFWPNALLAQEHPNRPITLERLEPKISESENSEPRDILTHLKSTPESGQESSPTVSPRNQRIEGEIAEGEITEGEITEGEITEGEITEGEITEGEITATEPIAESVTEASAEPIAPHTSPTTPAVAPSLPDAHDTAPSGTANQNEDPSFDPSVAEIKDECPEPIEANAPNEPIDDPHASSFSATDPATQASLALAFASRHTCLTPPAPEFQAYLPSVDEDFSLEDFSLHDRIVAFTVNVWGETSWGSGVIVQRQPTPEGWDYLVVTNSHVIRDDSVNIHTFDRQVHNTVILLDDRDSGYDLALLRFSSDQEYEVANTQPEVQENELTIAAGFPFDQADLDQPENSEIHGTKGKIVHILDEALVDGYQYAYSNTIEKGMSGGPVLNQYGELIAINGLHAHPLWGNSFVYPDGRSIDPELVALAEASSWSIPITTVIDRIAEYWINPVILPGHSTVILRNGEEAEIGMNP
jgi:S1-C subfamily serine protease